MRYRNTKTIKARCKREVRNVLAIGDGYNVQG
jgi:hypothetical protein